MKFRAGFIILSIANGVETIKGLLLYWFASGFMYIPGTLWIILLVVSALIISCWFAFYKIAVNRRQKLSIWALIPFFIIGALNAFVAVFYLNGGSVELVPAMLYMVGCVLLIKFARSVIGENNAAD